MEASLGWVTVGISAIFLVEYAGKLAVFGLRDLRHPLHLLDLIVVVASLGAALALMLVDEGALEEVGSKSPDCVMYCCSCWHQCIVSMHTLHMLPIPKHLNFCKQ